MFFKSDLLISDQISFDLNSNTISFIGNKIETHDTPKMVDIKFTLINSLGENKCTQRVIVYPWQESLVEEVRSTVKNEKTDPSMSGNSTATVNEENSEGIDQKSLNLQKNPNKPSLTISV